MKNSSTKQTLIEDIKREVLADLNRSHGLPYQNQRLIDGIKREVMAELNQYRPGHPSYLNRNIIDSIKNEVLANIQSEMSSGSMYIGKSAPMDSAMLETVKREVIAQIETEREALEESRAQEQDKNDPRKRITLDPNLVQAIKDSIMADMNIPYYK